MYVFTETEEAGICCEEGGGFTHIHVMIHIPPHVWHDMPTQSRMVGSSPPHKHIPAWRLPHELEVWRSGSCM